MIRHAFSIVLGLTVGLGFVWVPSNSVAQAPTKYRAEPLLLVGTVVTMNEKSEVFPRGYVLVRDGRIARVASDLAALGDDANDAHVVETNGVIYPGMIDLHNHPEYAIYPLLPIKRKYKDRYEWRFYDESYARRITYLNDLLTRPFYLDLGADVGRYGEYRALVGGTTSIQGARVLLPYAKDECLVRNIETTAVTARLAFSRVDIGRDADEWQRMREELAKGPLVVHLAEGTGQRMANEFEAVKRSGLLGPELVVVHGVGMTAAQLNELAAAGGKLVWSPLSNFMLYGQTADIAAAKRAGLSISLAPDWGPSGSKSSLGELKVAALINQHALGNLFTNEQLVRMVTSEPAKAMGWTGRLGMIAEGALADLVVFDARQPDVYENLIRATEAHLQLVLVRGEPLYGDASRLRELRSPADIESLPTRKAGREKAIVPNCAGSALPNTSVAQVSSQLQQALSLAPELFAKKVPAVQFEKDLAQCSGAKPSDPPTRADAVKLLRCRFNLPYEKTRLSPLSTVDDPEFFQRLFAIPHLPRYLRGLQSYYR